MMDGRRVAALVGCRASEIVFTSGGTEGDNLAISGLARPGDHIITSTIEHHAVLNTCKHLQENGCEVSYIPVDGRGLVDPDEVRRALRPSTRLITIMMARTATNITTIRPSRSAWGDCSRWERAGALRPVLPRWFCC